MNKPFINLYTHVLNPVLPWSESYPLSEDL
jgi:hypothetical protein